MTRKKWIVPSVALAAALVVGWVLLRDLDTGPAPPAAAAEAPRAASADPEIPRIDLERLDRSRPPTAAGRRDIFDFATPPPPPARPMPPARPAVEVAPPPVTAPTPPPLPALSVKYIGTIENKRGLKVAMLLTDRKEVLTGQAGELVANRFKIVRIGIESVDIQEVGSEQVRRIPLKGN